MSRRLAQKKSKTDKNVSQGTETIKLLIKTLRRWPINYILWSTWNTIANKKKLLSFLETIFIVGQSFHIQITSLLNRSSCLRATWSFEFIWLRSKLNLITPRLIEALSRHEQSKSLSGSPHQLKFTQQSQQYQSFMASEREKSMSGGEHSEERLLRRRRLLLSPKAFRSSNLRWFYVNKIISAGCGKLYL